jgi:hypothetical protein
MGKQSKERDAVSLCSGIADQLPLSIVPKLIFGRKMSAELSLPSKGVPKPRSGTRKTRGAPGAPQFSPISYPCLSAFIGG